MGESAPTPEQLLARTIRAHRNRLHVTAQQVADRIAELGGRLTRQAISKIETGDRGISVDELFFLAEALNTAPLLLLFPVGLDDVVEYLPGKAISPWDAAKWFSGEVPEAADRAAYWAVPLYLFRQHDALLDRYLDLLALNLTSPPPDDPDRPALRAQLEAQLRRLRDIRAEMRRHGLTPPPLDDDLRHIDERRHVYLTPEQAAGYDAEHPGDLRIVNYATEGRRQGRPNGPEDT